MREALPMTRRRATALAVIVVTVTACLGTYIHDNPLGITPIADINAGMFGYGENVTIKGVIVEILLLTMGPHDQWVTVSDGYGNISLYWYDSRLEVGWVIIARGSVLSIHELFGTQWLERVWLFA